MRHYFAYLSRMRLIRRWGLMRNTYEENIQEHSLQVGLVATGWHSSATPVSAAKSMRTVS